MNDVTVVICTHNPKIEKLLKVMDSTTTGDKRFTLKKILIDNASANSSEIERLAFNKNFKYILEPNLGLSKARFCAFNNVLTGLLIFVDDDNYLDSSFITNAYDFWITHPEVMAFGGRARSLLVPKQKWKIEMLQYLGARDLGTETRVAKTSSIWQPEEPIGAGLCLSPILVKALRKMTQEELTTFFSLGRSGKNLISGEDGFICRYLYPAGYVAYVPSLLLDHDIDISRARLPYLIRLMYNYGRSDYMLSIFLRQRQKAPDVVSYQYKLQDFFSYIKKFSFSSFLISFRVLGFVARKNQFKEDMARVSARE